MDAIPADAQVSLSLTINEKGQPENIQVTKSFSRFWDARVIDTVREFHFKPATVDNQPTPVDMNLVVNITR
jgi:TonB family protein